MLRSWKMPAALPASFAALREKERSSLRCAPASPAALREKRTSSRRSTRKSAFEKSALACVGYGFGAVGGVQLREDRAHVKFHCALADEECFCNALIGCALGKEPQHLALARGERWRTVAHLAEQLRCDD